MTNTPSIERIASTISEILSDKYGLSVSVNFSRVPASEDEERGEAEGAA